MDDDTSFVVGIIIIICIVVVIGYSIYSYFASIDPRKSELFKFKNSAPFTHAALSPTLPSKTLKMPHLITVTCPLLDMGKSQLTLFSGEKIHSIHGL
jgi:hypothetical protein